MFPHTVGSLTIKSACDTSVCISALTLALPSSLSAPQVCVFAFDCLYHNGVSLLHEPLTKRRDTLHATIKEVPGQVAQATTKISNDVEELEVRARLGKGGGKGASMTKYPLQHHGVTGLNVTQATTKISNNMEELEVIIPHWGRGGRDAGLQGLQRVWVGCGKMGRVT